MFYTVSYRDHVTKTMGSAKVKVSTATATFTDVISTLYSNVFHFADQDAVKNLFSLYEDGHALQANHFANTEDLLRLMKKTSNLIDTILLITPEGEYYSSQNIRLAPSHQSIDVWPDHRKQFITWLSARSSPYVVPEKQIIPLSFSFGYTKGFTSYVSKFVESPTEIVFRLFLFLDYEKTVALLQADDSSSYSITYLVDDQYNPISVAQSAYFYDTVTNEQLRSQLGAIKGPGEIHLENDSFLVYVGEAMPSDARVINITSKKALFSSYRSIANLIYSTCAAVIALSVLLSSLLSRWLSDPLRKLVASVYAIGERNPATKPFVPKYKDEVGQLGLSIHQMRSIIEQQIETIKEEERKRSDAEIQILSQQINPHFLYNTLDCIRWEIVGGNTEGAGKMVESLSLYLRLGFGHSTDIITIRDEITRLEQYVHIMSHRTHGNVSFSSYIDPKLEHFLIPPMVLQPLVENSFKHGFASEIFKSAMQEMELFIRCSYTSAQEITISVEDNGAGIDIARAQDAINFSLKDPSRSNIGLRNSLLRLQAHFGKENVQIRFSSTPFFLNSVAYIITTPETPSAD